MSYILSCLKDKPKIALSFDGGTITDHSPYNNAVTVTGSPGKSIGLSDGQDKSSLLGNGNSVSFPTTLIDAGNENKSFSIETIIKPSLLSDYINYQPDPSFEAGLNGYDSQTTMTDNATLTQVSEVDLATNLITNPAFRDTNGTVEIARNLSPDAAPTPPSGVGSAAAGSTATTTFGTDTDLGVYARCTFNGDTSSAMNSGLNFGNEILVTPGQAYSAALSTRTSRSGQVLGFYFQFLDSTGANIGNNLTVTPSTVAGQGYRLVLENKIAPAGAVSVRVLVYGVTASADVWHAGDTIDAGMIMVNSGSTILPFFSGDTVDDQTFDYSWTGTPGNSESIKTARSTTAVAENGTARPAYQLGSDSTVMEDVPGSSDGWSLGPFDYGKSYTAIALIESLDPDETLDAAWQFYDGSSANGGTVSFLPTSTPQWFTLTTDRPLANNGSLGRLYLYSQFSAGIIIHKLIVVESPYSDSYFDGNDLDCKWTGLADQSTSVKYIGPHSGSKFLQITNTSGASAYGYNGTLVTDPAIGSIIRGSAWVYVPSINTNSQYPQIRVGGSPVTAANSDAFTGPYDQWTQISVEVPVVAAGTAVMYIYGQSTSGESIYYDDLYTAIIPSTSTTTNDIADGLISITDTKLSFGTTHEGGNAQVTYDLEEFSRLHVVGIHTQNKNSLYINGQLIDSVDVSEFGPYVTSPGNMTIGNSASTQDFAISNFNLYEYAISDITVEKHYNDSLPKRNDISVRTAFGGESFRFSAFEKNAYINILMDEDNGFDGVGTAITLNDALETPLVDDLPVDSYFITSVNLDNPSGSAIYGVMVSAEGEGFSLQCSLDNTTFTTMDNNSLVPLINQNDDPTGKTLWIKVNLDGTASEQFVTLLSIKAYSIDPVLIDSGRYLQLDADIHDQQDYMYFQDNIGVTGSVTITADTSSDQKLVGTEEFWLKANDVSTLSLDAGTIYVNGAAGTAADIHNGQWSLVHVVRTPAIKPINISGDVQIQSIGNYPDALDASTIAEIYANYMGSDPIELSESNSIGVSSDIEPPYIYANDWAITSGG